MNLIIDGQNIELSADVRFGFAKKNQLFAFGDLQCERSQSFSIPNTPTNARILGIASNPAMAGGAMRKRFDAQMQDGAVVKNGYLYVTEYNKNTYNAVFITGEMLGMKKAAEAGYIWQNVESAAAVWNAKGAGVESENIAQNAIGGQIKYRTNEGLLLSWGLLAAANNKITQTPELNGAFFIDWSGAGLDNTGLFAIPSKIAGARSGDAEYVSQAGDFTPVAGVITANTINTRKLGLTLASEEVRNVGFYTTQRTPDTDKYKVLMFVALQELSLTFRKDLPDNLFLVDLPTGEYEELYSTKPPLTFYGDYSFNARAGWPYTNYEVTGKPLGGRAVTIPQGARFLLMRKENYRNEYIYFRGRENRNQGYTFNTNDTALTFDELVKIEGTAANGANIRYTDLYPDLSVIDVAKIVAAVQGVSLFWDDAAKTLRFEDFATIDVWPQRDVSGRVLSKSASVSRVFRDYKQHNYVRYNSNDYVAASDVIRAAYDVENAYLDTDSDLYVLPFSEGKEYGGDVYVDATKSDSGEISTGARATLAYAGAGTGEYMMRAYIKENATLQRLTKASTKVVVTLLWSLLEFDALKERDVILIDGVRYLWTDANYNAGRVQLTLQKIE